MQIQGLVAGVVVIGLLVGTGPWLAAEGKADEVIAAARKAIADKKLDALKTLSVEASVQRNVNTMQLTSDVEILLELPDKYVRTDTSSGPMAGGFSIGFNGDKPIRPANSMSMGGGGMIIRIGPGGSGPSPERKLTPEEQVKADAQMLRMARMDVSRLMLGWFAVAHPSLSAEYVYAGEAESPDGKAHVIDARNADGFAARLFIDQQTNLPLMVTFQGPQPRMVTAGGPRGGRQGGPARAVSDEERRKMREAAATQMEALQSQPPTMVEHTWFFEEWREVSGVKFPHKLRRASAGTTNEEWTITSVKVNPRIDARKFEG
jgi:hypothetical protein